MKKVFYLCSVLFLLCLSCQDNETNGFHIEEGNQSNTNFSLLIPEYEVLNTRVVSTENNLLDMSLLLFDTNGLFIGKQQATNLSVTETGGIGSGTFNAQIPNETRIIHFVANYDNWNSFDERESLGKDEREIITGMVSHSLTFWGRSLRTTETTINTVLYRNKAKVTVENQAAGFQVTGYAIANFLISGTVAPFDPNATPTPFVVSTAHPTIPSGNVAKGSQTQNECDLTAKYMFPNENPYTDQTYAIIKGKLNGGTELYYKIQFLNTDKLPYHIIRNNQYKIVIKSFSGNANGTTTFEAAKDAPPSNNIYAEILKESTTISDDKNNVLIVGGISYLFITGGTLNVSARYFVNGTQNNSQISVTKVQDDNNILSNLQYNSANATVTATVASVIAGQQQATFLVKAGSLTRTIKVVSTPAYSFAPVTLSPSVYTARDQDIKLRFTIPSTIPAELFPLDCYITTKYLYSVSPNNNMLVETTADGYNYIYEAQAPGVQTVSFKTSLENNDETITIKNEYFNTASINLRARHFTNVSINNNNIVNYGANASAILTFNFSDIVGNSATYPLTVTVATQNLQTTQSGWTAVPGGYSRTFTNAQTSQQSVNFTSNKAISKESIVISAPGFAPTTLTYDNTLNQNVTVTGNIRIIRNGIQYTYPSRSVSSSKTALVNGFTSSATSTYSISLKSGAALTDMLTFSSTYLSVTYYASFTIEQLLASPTIILR